MIVSRQIFDFWVLIDFESVYKSSSSAKILSNLK